MGLIAALIATALCSVVYVRMIRREVPEPISKKQAAIPAVLGLLSVFLATMLMIGFGAGIKALFGSVSEAVSSLVLRSLVSSFFLAGFTEEVVKLLMFLATIKIVKPKNVYEYGLLCAGVGFGFTALEEFIYSGSSPVAMVLRIFFFAMHVVFGLLMGLHLGLAKDCRLQGRGGAGKHVFLALFLPVLWHTLFDAATTSNAAFNSDDESVKIAGAVIALIVCAASIAGQIILLVRFKKNTQAYCAMRLIAPEDAAAPVTEDAADAAPRIPEDEDPGIRR